MNLPKLGDTGHFAFRTSDATGAVVDADVPPTGTVLRNGVATAVPVTITDRGVGLYDAAADLTAANGFAVGDYVSVSIDATVAAVAAGGVIANFVLEVPETGPNTVTITVLEAVTLDPISGAVLWIRDATETFTCALATTNGAGEAEFLLADGTYRVKIVAVGYTFAVEDLVVAGDTADTYQGTPFAAHPNPVVVTVPGTAGTLASAQPVFLVVGATAVPLEGHLRELDGTTAVDLTTAVSVVFNWWQDGGRALIDQYDCVVTDALNGEVQHYWEDEDLDKAERYWGEYQVEWSGGKWEKFPARWPIDFRVRHSLSGAPPPAP